MRQPDPIPNDSVDIQTLVVEDLIERRAVGMRKYGTALQAHNGRDALQDAYEEALDLCCYLKQAIVERGTQARLRGIASPSSMDATVHGMTVNIKRPTPGDQS
jgi:hypothetical protein